jgi:iron complex transport system permease protein
MTRLPYNKLPIGVLFPALVVAVFAAALLALTSGSMDIPAAHVAASLLQAAGVGVHTALDATESTTILQLRLPRLVLALLVGASLAQAGAAMQAVFRNPLADPGLVGVSSGAALAAVTVIVLGRHFGWTQIVPMHWLLPVASFAGGAVVTFLVLRLASFDGMTRPSTLLLAGLAINAIAGAGIGFLSQIADSGALRSLTFWMFGSLGKAGWSEILTGAPLLLLPVLWLPREAAALNALLLGEAEAGHLGVDVERLKRRVLFIAVLAVGAGVALCGIIGFVGLVVPHLIRLIFGPDHRLLLPASGLLGAVLLCLADTCARTVLMPAELPVGILTALIGGPFFLVLLLRYRRGTEIL